MTVAWLAIYPEGLAQMTGGSTFDCCFADERPLDPPTFSTARYR
jgi:hypothetical protein